MCILLYVKLIWCSGIPQVYGQLERRYICHKQICILLYVKLIWCSGIPQIYGQLEEVGPWYMCILLYVKLIWCSGIPQIYGQLEEEGVHLPQVYVHSAISETYLVWWYSIDLWSIGVGGGPWYMCILVYVQLTWCSGIPWIYGGLGGTSAQGICALCYM